MKGSNVSLPGRVRLRRRAVLRDLVAKGWL